MTTEEVQQILGLLVNAGLAMSTLVIFLIARRIHKNKKKIVEVHEAQQKAVEFKSNDGEDS